MNLVDDKVTDLVLPRHIELAADSILVVVAKL